jgi:hypothetical protein
MDKEILKSYLNSMLMDIIDESQQYLSEDEYTMYSPIDVATDRFIDMVIRIVENKELLK